MKDREDVDAWHLDKKVPIALIVTILLQAFAFTWWASSQSSLITMHERRLDTAERRIDGQDTRMGTISERVIKIETNTDNIAASMQRIEQVIIRQGRDQPR